MLSRAGWQTEQSPFRVAPREKRADTKLRRKPVGKGYRLSKGVIDALNDGRKRKASVNAMNRLAAAIKAMQK